MNLVDYKPKPVKQYHRPKRRGFYGRGPLTSFPHLLENRREIQRNTFTQGVDGKDRKELESLLGFKAHHSQGVTITQAPIKYYKQDNLFYFIYNNEVFIFC